MSSPALTHVQLDWSGADVELPDSRIPPLFDGDVMRLVGRITGELPTKVTLRCQSAIGQRVAWTLDVPPAQEDQQQISYQWARDVLARCDEHSPREECERFLQISQQFNLLCPLTAFVAIEHRSAEDRNSGQPSLREVPVMLAQGWGGIQADRMPVQAMWCAMPSARRTLHLSRHAESTQVTMSIFGDASPRFSAEHCDGGGSLPAADSATDSVATLMSLLKQQDSTGAFMRS